MLRSDDRLLALASLLAAGAVLVGCLRMGEAWSEAAQLVVSGVAAAALLGAALRAGQDGEDGGPSARTSVLLLAGLAVWALASYALLAVLAPNDPFTGRRSVVAIFGLVALAAAVGAWRTGSAAALLLAALGVGGGALAILSWLVSPDGSDAYSALLVGLAVLYAAVASRIRDRPRHRDVLVDAAGLSLAAVGYAGGALFTLYGYGTELAWGWEAVLLAGGLGLAAYAVHTRAPGPGVLALLVFALFVSSAMVVGGDTTDDFFVDEYVIVEGGDGGDPTLLGWPVALAALAAAAAMGAVVRRRSAARRRRQAAHAESLTA